MSDNIGKYLLKYPYWRAKTPISNVSVVILNPDPKPDIHMSLFINSHLNYDISQSNPTYNYILQENATVKKHRF